jgi:hypothetical protein
MSRFENQTSQETFDDFTAVGIAEGFIDCDSEDDMIKAWQHLVDTGLAWKLQGWFGRTAHDLIEQGLLKAKAND